MGVLVELDENPDWDDDPLRVGLPGWEAWEEYDTDERYEPDVGCAYCGNLEVRENPEPFGGKQCCDPCFNILIGGDEDDPAWRCGNGAA